MKSWFCLEIVRVTQYRNNTIEKKEIIQFELDGDFGCYILEGVLMVDHHLEIIT